MNTIVERIGNFHEKNDTFAFYKRVMRCIDECLDLVIAMNLFSDELLNRKRRAKDIWENKYEKELLHGLLTINGKEQVKHSFDKNHYIHTVLNFYLYAFEEFPEDERAYIMEYFVPGLTRIGGVKEDSIKEIIRKHFKEILE